MPDLKLNLRMIAVVTAALGGFILAPSQGCVAGPAQQDTAGPGDAAKGLSRPMDESGRPTEKSVTGHRFELVPHVKDGGENIYIKTPFLYEEGPSEAPEPLWV